MYKDDKKKNIEKNAKKTIKKPEKKAAKSAKKPALKKTAKKAVKPTGKPAVKKTVKTAAKPVKTVAGPTAKVPVEKIKKETKPEKKHIQEAPPVIPGKPDTSDAPGQDLSLPEGSVYQQTGQRRPLIVFPK